MTEITVDTKLTKELLKEFKAEYKKIYRTVLSDGTEIIWHRLNRKQYKELMKKYETITDREERLWAREEEACRAAVIYPCSDIMEDLIENCAGVATVLSDAIYEKSGFQMVDTGTEEVQE